MRMPPGISSSRGEKDSFQSFTEQLTLNPKSRDAPKCSREHRLTESTDSTQRHASRRKESHPITKPIDTRIDTRFPLSNPQPCPGRSGTGNRLNWGVLCVMAIFRQLSSTAARLRCKVFQIDRRISQQGEYNAAGGTSPGCRVPGV
jgi:hypothetical protein